MKCKTKKTINRNLTGSLNLLISLPPLFKTGIPYNPNAQIFILNFKFFSHLRDKNLTIKFKLAIV